MFCSGSVAYLTIKNNLVKFLICKIENSDMIIHMHEGIPQNNNESKESIENAYISLAVEIIEGQEVYDFPEINTGSYNLIKEQEDEMPGFTTPVDEVIEKFRLQGMKVVAGKNLVPGKIYILPAQSDDITNDSFFSRHLNIENIKDEKMRELIILSQKLKNK